MTILLCKPKKHGIKNWALYQLDVEGQECEANFDEDASKGFFIFDLRKEKPIIVEIPGVASTFRATSSAADAGGASTSSP